MVSTCARMAATSRSLLTCALSPLGASHQRLTPSASQLTPTLSAAACPVRQAHTGPTPPPARLRVPLSRKPMRIRSAAIPGQHNSRLETLRRTLTQLFREERIEITKHRAFETRQYVERLLQMAIEFGPSNEHTMQMVDWWVMEKELVHKLFKVLVPRLKDLPCAYTSVYHLPVTFLPVEKEGRFKAAPLPMSIIELKGNPYPPVLARRADHRNSLLNILVDEARKAKSKAEAPS